MDARANELVWRSTATDVLRPNASPEEKDRALGEAVAKMFKDFPPPRRA